MQRLKVVPSYIITSYVAGDYFQALRNIIAPAAPRVRQQSSLIIMQEWEYFYKKTKNSFLNFTLFPLTSHCLTRICSEQCLEICMTSTTARPGDWLNGVENGKTQLFNSRGVVKLFPKKWSVHLILFPLYLV